MPGPRRAAALFTIGAGILAVVVASELRADPSRAGREEPVVVVAPGRGSGVVVQGRSAGRQGPVIWWSIGDTPVAPPKSPSPYEGLEVKPAGRLHLVVNPPDARVWVDGNPLPPGSDVSVGLLTGRYTVQVAREGYETQSHQVEIERAKAAQLQIVLEPEAP